MLYMVTLTINIPQMLAYIPWILWVIDGISDISTIIYMLWYSYHIVFDNFGFSNIGIQLIVMYITLA